MSGRLAARIAASLTTALCAAAAAVDVPEDIRDIRGPKIVHPPWLVPVLVSAGVLLALCAYAVWRWRRRRQSPRALLPFEVALQRLEEIRLLMKPAMAREFGIAVSDIVRRYIESRFEVTATQRTTEEFLQDLLKSSNESLARHRPLLSEFLQRCDLVKFAGLAPAPRLMESLRQSARSFVLETVEAHDALPAT
jgi:HAMP domain-containing protein